MNFYNYFLSLCSSAGVKPSPAGEAVGVSRTAVNGWKNGRLPTDSTLQALSDYFKIPVSEFWKCDDIAEKRGLFINVELFNFLHGIKPHFCLFLQLFDNFFSYAFVCVALRNIHTIYNKSPGSAMPPGNVLFFAS